MEALAPSSRRAPRLGAIGQQRMWQRNTARRWLIAAVAVLSLATASHHLLPMHDAMSPMSGMQHEHATPVMTACLGVVGASFLLAYAGSVIRVPRLRRRRPTAIRRGSSQPLSSRGRPPSRDGPPPYLRFQALRT